MIITEPNSVGGISDICYTFTEFFILKSSKKKYRVSLNFSKIKEFKNKTNIKKFLHHDENEYFDTLKYSRRINSFLLGRYSAKKAILGLTNEKDPQKILIKNGIFNQPIVACDLFSNIQISLTHCDDLAAAVAFSDMLILGIDIEKINRSGNKGIEAELTQYEKELAKYVNYSYECFLFMVWTIKESLSKVLKTGLTVPLSILELKNIQAFEGYFVSTFTNFLQYKSISYIVEDYVCSITFPKNVEIYLDISKVKNNLNNIEKAEYIDLALS